MTGSAQQVSVSLSRTSRAGSAPAAGAIPSGPERILKLCRTHSCCFTVAQISALPHIMMAIASPLSHPATPLLIRLADLVFKLASPGRPCGPAYIASGTRACCNAARITVVTSAASPPHIPRSLPSPSGHGSTLARPPPGPRPRPGNTPGHGQRLRHVSVVTFPGSRPVVTSSRYLTSPGHGSIPSSRPPGHVPIPIAVHPLASCSHCSDCGALPVGVFMEPSSKPGAGIAWHSAALYSKRTLAQSLGPPASLPAGAAEENKPILLCSSSLHTLGSPALLRISGRAVSVNRGAVEVLH
jgi:hypothetical protein